MDAGHDAVRDWLQRTLARCEGNRKQTAETLGIGVRTLFNKLKASDAATAVGV